MDELISNMLRGSVSSVMIIILLFTLTKTDWGLKRTILIASIVLVINIVSTFWFYLHGDLTSLSRFNLIVFLIIGFALMPMTKLPFMHWSFTFITLINISMIVIILSFHLGRLFPYPQYGNTIFRLVLYLIIIFLFKRYLLTLYQSIINNWSVFLVLVIAIFLNLSYYFYVTDDIKETLVTFKGPLLLLVLFSVSAYGTIFYSLKKFKTIGILEKENIQIQKETVQLEQYANYDMLTGLPNRRLFYERLKELIEERKKDLKKIVLLYIDLDGFKDINDKYGHEFGDKTLITISNRLLGGIRKSDFVARLGGDEFAIIIHDIDDSNVVKSFAEKTLELIQAEIETDSICYNIDASIGIALYPDTGKDCNTLIRNADFAMYQVKKEGKSGIKIFENQLG